MSNQIHIPNPCPGASDASRCYANLDPEIDRYFFRQMFAGDRGVKAAIINTLFKALHDECLRQSIPAAWDPTSENQKAVAKLLSSISFNVKPTTTTRRRPARA